MPDEEKMQQVLLRFRDADDRVWIAAALISELRPEQTGGPRDDRRATIAEDRNRFRITGITIVVD